MTAAISADPAGLDNTMAADRQDEETADTLAVVPSLDDTEGNFETRIAQCESIMGSQRRYIAELEAHREVLIDQADEAVMLKAELEALRGVLAERNATLTTMRHMLQCVR